VRDERLVDAGNNYSPQKMKKAKLLENVINARSTTGRVESPMDESTENVVDNGKFQTLWYTNGSNKGNLNTHRGSMNTQSRSGPFFSINGVPIITQSRQQQDVINKVPSQSSESGGSDSDQYRRRTSQTPSQLTLTTAATERTKRYKGQHQCQQQQRQLGWRRVAVRDSATNEDAHYWRMTCPRCGSQRRRRIINGTKDSPSSLSRKCATKHERNTASISTVNEAKGGGSCCGAIDLFGSEDNDGDRSVSIDVETVAPRISAELLSPSFESEASRGVSSQTSKFGEFIHRDHYYF
jgi:hypothetical protein